MLSITAMVTQLVSLLSLAGGGRTAVSPDNDIVDVMSSVDADRTSWIPRIDESTKFEQIKLEGDIMLGGLFPVHGTRSFTEMGENNNPCAGISEHRGVHRVEAMLYALDQINRDPNILPGITIGAHILDSCGAPAYALNQSLAFVRGLIGEGTDHYTCSNAQPPQLLDEFKPQPIVSVVGGSYSGVSVQVANLLGLFKIVQVSYASTNAALSNKKKFEYFARTVPSDELQAQAMVDICVHFKWNYVTLIYSNGDYGQMGADAFKEAARRKKVCIATEEKIAKHEQLDEIIRNMYDKSVGKDTRTGARVVILYTRNDDTSKLLQIAHQHGTANKAKVIFLASEAWEMQPDTTHDVEETAEGALVLSLSSQRIHKFDEYFTSLRPGTPNFERNSWLRELWISKFGCTFDIEKYPNRRPCHEFHQMMETFHPDNKVQFVIDAVYAIAHALHAKWRDDCRQLLINKWDLTNAKSDPLCPALNNVDGDVFYRKYLLNVSFTDVSGQNNFSFNADGDGPAYYKISNYQRRSPGVYHYVTVGKWMNGHLKMDNEKMFWNIHDNETSVTPHSSICSSPCRLGEVKQTAGAGDDIYCCWTCRKCEPHQKLANISTCEDCPEGFYPDAKRVTCDLMPLEYLRWSSAYAVLPVILSCLGIAVTIVVMVIYVKYNATPVVKASGRELSYILLCAIIFCYSMTFVLLAKPTGPSCAMRRVGVGFGFALLYAAMLVKTNRIYRIFHYAKQNITPMFISPMSQVLIAGLLASVQIFGSALWLLFQWPGTRVSYPDRKTAVLKCNVPDALFLVSLVYDTGLIIACTVFAIKARRVPENFNEAKFIGFTMYTTCIIWLAFLPIYFGTGSDYQIQTTTLCISVSMSATVTLVLIFSPKLWVLIMEPEKNVRKQGDLSTRSKQTDYYDSRRQSTRLLARDAMAASPLITKNVSMERVTRGSVTSNSVTLRHCNNNTTDTTIANPCAIVSQRKSVSREAERKTTVNSTASTVQAAEVGVVNYEETYRSFQTSPSLNSMPGDRSTDQYL